MLGGVRCVHGGSRAQRRAALFRRPGGAARRCALGPPWVDFAKWFRELRAARYFCPSPRMTWSTVVWKVLIALALTFGCSSLPVTWIWRSSFFALVRRSPTIGSFGQFGLSVVKVMRTFFAAK